MRQQAATATCNALKPIRNDALMQARGGDAARAHTIDNPRALQPCSLKADPLLKANPLLKIAEALAGDRS